MKTIAKPMTIGLDVERAAQLLKQGLLVGMPTETVYGLAADASNKDALVRLFSAKGRPTNHPVIVHVASVDALPDWAVEVPKLAYDLAERFWPGPLTMIFKKHAHVLYEVTGGQETVAIRVPRHEVALSLLQKFGGGIAAPSANRFGKLSPTSASDVEGEFGDAVAYVLDGGTCEVGIESTIVDLSGAQPRVLRPGMLSLEQLNQIEGLHARNRDEAASAPRAPGTLKSHYSPSTPVKLVSGANLDSVLSELKNSSKKAAVLSFKTKRDNATQQANTAWIVAPGDPDNYARKLYSSLRQLDNLECDLIIVEEVPSTDSWSGIQDRLQRASVREGDQ
ncbi:MAG: L-threonylcarbamoyladenylate synthase [Candidatus Melainabacteria bacterium]|nr:L-threonylcarbamoyladenylate synthase [Candidatus Melainabacteria bacterium]